MMLPRYMSLKLLALEYQRNAQIGQVVNNANGTRSGQDLDNRGHLLGLIVT